MKLSPFIITKHAKDRFEKRSIRDCFNTSNIYNVFDKVVERGSWYKDQTSELGRWRCVYVEDGIEYTFIFEKDRRTCVTILSPQLICDSPKTYYTDEFDRSEESILFHSIQEFANSILNDFVRNPKQMAKRKEKIRYLLPTKIMFGKDFSKWPRKKKILHLFGRSLDPRSLEYLLKTLQFNPDVIDKRGCTTLHHICWRIKQFYKTEKMFEKEFYNDMFDSIKIMLSNGANISIENIEEDGNNKRAFDFLLEIEDYENKLPIWLNRILYMFKHSN